MVKLSKELDLLEKKTYGYRERDEEARKEFLEKIRGYAPERFVYIDEAGIDNTIDYPYGYCHKSERFEALKLGHCSSRVSVISGWWRDSIANNGLFRTLSIFKLLSEQGFSNGLS